MATTKALKSGFPQIGPNNLDPACAFPARRRLIEKSIGPITRSPVCDGIELWRHRLPLSSVSLVYASAYAGNPASMLGHTFFKLNLRTSNEKKSPLLDYAANFTAIPEDELGFLYFYRGLTGGYKGVFNLEPFYAHVVTYTQRENRDLWEYPLNLTHAERSLFVDHLWELYATASADYYFLDDNCSSLLLEILEAVRPDLDAKSKLGLFALPLQTIKSIDPLIQKDTIHFTASQNRVLSARFEKLNPKQQKTVQSCIGKFCDPSPIQNPDTIDTMIAWINFRKASLPLEAQGDLRNWEQKILIKRASLERPMTKINPAYKGGRPDEGHEPGRFALNYDARNQWTSIHWAMGMHSLLDPSIGFEPYFHLNYLDLKGRFDDQGSFNQYSFNVAEVISLEPVNRLTHPLSWRASGSLSPIQHPDCRNCQGIDLNAGIGLAWEILPRQLLVYSLPGLQIQSAYTDDLFSAIIANLMAKLFYAPADVYRLQFGINRSQQRSLKIAKHTLETEWNLDQQFNFAQNSYFGLDLSASPHTLKSVQLTTGFRY